MTYTRAFVVSLLTFAAAPIAAQDRTVDLLRQLTDTPGPPGFEEPIRKVMVDQMKPFAASITYDGLGSIIATQGPAGPESWSTRTWTSSAASCAVSRPAAC